MRLIWQGAGHGHVLMRCCARTASVPVRADRIHTRADRICCWPAWIRRRASTRLWLPGLDQIWTTEYVSQEEVATAPPGTRVHWHG
jgi:hypothetical protein